MAEQSSATPMRSPGTAFRRSHPGRVFPLWIAKMLEFSGEDDPGFESLWQSVKGSIAAGTLAVDTDVGDPVGLLVHLTPFVESRDTDLEEPESGWFDREANARVPAIFPLGVPSEVRDPDLTSFRNELLGIREPEPERPIADTVVEVIDVWSGDSLSLVSGGPVSIAPNELYLLHWMAALTADSPPRFELLVEPAGSWTPPPATPDYAVVSKSGSMTSIGPVQNTGGWHVWWTARSATAALAALPDGSSIDMAMAPRLEDDDEGDPAIGRALYSGVTRNRFVEIRQASPKIDHNTLASAIAFARDLAVSGRISVRAGAERAAFDQGAAMYLFEQDSLVWSGDVVHLAEPDERTLLILAGPVFRVRYGAQWPMDAVEDEDDD